MLGHFHQWSSAAGCNCTCSFRVNNTNKGNSAAFFPPRWLLFKPPVKACSSVHARWHGGGDETESVHVSSLQPVQLCKQHAALRGPIWLFGDSPRLSSCYVQTPHLLATQRNTLIPCVMGLFRNMDASSGITFDLINHFGFHHLRVKSASSYSLYFEINPPGYAQASSSVSCSD